MGGKHLIKPEQPLAPMDPELKRKWIAALLDPTRKQGRGALRRGDKFCCLGEFCNVIDPNAWVPDRYSKLAWRDQRHYDYPPEDVLPIETSDYFASLNDDRHHTFKTIARAVELYVPDAVPT